MKILNRNSVIGIACLFFMVLGVACKVSDAPEGNLKKNQMKAFPNTNEAPTMPDQIKESDYKAPKFSDALNEADATRRLRKSEFIDTVKYAVYNMTRGEMEQIFVFVDQNKDDMINHKEWEAFKTLFILPFEACDKNKNGEINEEEFGLCFDHDPKNKFIEFRKSYQEKRHSLIMSIVSTRGSNQINFSDYLFIRKAMFGWKQCHSNAKYIAKSQFRCALSAAIPQKYYSSKINYETIYNTGLKLAADKNLIELDFISYLRILYFTYVFGVFNQPADSASLEKSQFIKAVREDRLPNNFDENEIDFIFSQISVSPTSKSSYIDFNSWCFFFALHRAFSKYAVENPLKMSQAEFLNLLNDPFTNKEILNAVDSSFTKIDEQQYLEASLVLQRYRLNERDFFNARFKQDSSAAKTPAASNSTYYTITPNAAAREVFFSTFTDTNKKYMVKENLFKAFQLANLYVQLPGTPVSSTTLIEKLPSFYDLIIPPINLKQRNNYALYKAIPRDIGVDILTFFALENYFTKLQILSIGSNVNIDETAVKRILADFGMQNMPDTVLDLAEKGFDTLHRRLFIPLDVAKNTLVVHAVASEKMRNQNSIKSNNLKLNKEASRLFPQENRRLESSDKV